MNSIKSLFLFAPKEESRWRRTVKDSILVLGSISLLTALILISHLPTRIPDSFLLYLLAILVLACLRGLYAALLALLMAFFTFDFLFVAPIYSFAAAKFEDVVGLVVFFITAVITSHLASALRVHAVEASRREGEMRILYDVLRASNREQERLREASVDLQVLRKTEAQRSALFSSVSHGLRTPLATIKAAASNLLQERVHWEAEERRSFASTIEQEVDRLDALVDMSRIEAGNLRLEKVWYPLDELLLDVVDRMQTLLGKRAVHMLLPENLPPVEIDTVQIEQVMINILENAAHYTPEGSPLDISIQVQEEKLLVSIADQGPGIPPAESRRVFDKFYRLPDEGDALNPRGMGLGLAICQGVIEAHGGRIWVQDREGGGAIFCFTLPYSKLEEGDINE